MNRLPRFSARLAAALSLTALAGCAGMADGETPDPTDTNVNCEEGVCILTGTLTEDLTLTSDTAWLLRGGVFIGDGANETVLTIEPGTTVYGETSTTGMLVVRRHAKIMAEGTADAPIVFTSSKEEGTRARGDWGGVIINGNASVNGCDEAPCESFGEGGTGYYGGSDDDDDSGVLSYVRIEFAGQLISPDNELNGLALQGVGRGTVVDHIQIHMGKDDCIEFFGGTAEAKYILCTGAADDNLDWTDGWRGKLQFLVAQQYDDAGDNGIEADNNGENNEAAPRSFPTISNITLIGAPGSDQSDLGMLLREGTGAHIANAVVTGWGDACLDVDHDATFANAVDSSGALTGGLVVEHSVFDCDTSYQVDEDETFDVGNFVETLNEGNQVAGAELTDPFEPGGTLTPSSASPAMSGAQVPSDAFFTQVSFKGGIDPDDDWTQGWTTHARN